MEHDLYDEFGNLVGQEPAALDPESANESEIYLSSDEAPVAEVMDTLPVVASTYLANKSLYDVFANDVDILVETEDTQSLNTPIVGPTAYEMSKSENAIFTKLKQNIPRAMYDRRYMLDLMNIPERIRNVAVIGPLHSGKTSLVDLFVVDSHKRAPQSSHNVQMGWKPMKYMDNTKQEIERGLSTKLNGMTFLSTDLDDKSVVLNLLDVPGHVNFMDETAVALSAVEYAIVCIDVVEGITSIVEKLIKQCQRKGIEMIFVLNKIDRLILELKLPAMDTYLKLKHVVDEINSFTTTQFFPELGNVIFASSKLNFTFTIKEFVSYYYANKLPSDKVEEFQKKLWGNIYFENGRFSNEPTNKTLNPTFLEFILLPLYKIFTHTLTQNPENLTNLLKDEFSINLEPSVLKYDPQPLLRHVLKTLFKKQTGIVHAITELSPPTSISKIKLKYMLREEKTLENTDLLAHCFKTADIGNSEWTFVRIYKGSIQAGSRIRLLDSTNDTSLYDTNSEDDDIDEYPLLEIKELGLISGRYILRIKNASEGQIVLVKGLSEFFTKSATIYLGTEPKIPIFKNIDYINKAVFKIVIEPLEPKELPKLLDGLNKANKYYPGLVTRVEESGEYIILGFGELYLDCFLYDLRNNYSNMEIKISNPLTIFSEGCSGESFAAIPVTSSNKNITVSIGAQPLDHVLLKDLTLNKISKDAFDNPRKLAKTLRTDYGWDSLAARNIWSLYKCNAFVDDTLPDEVDNSLLTDFKKQICQGFYWATREGPLSEEPVHGIHFRLLNIEIENPDDPTVGNQLIPLIRKACYVAIMTSNPILLEPIFEINIVSYSALLPIIEQLLNRRRGGRIYKTHNIVGTPLMEIKCQLPVIESIGFETDLRLSTQGRAMCQLHFWNKIWRKVPGDVMDEDAAIPKLKPAPYNSLSRDFVMKTRRRKGISNEGFMSNNGPSIKKYIELELYQSLKENNLV